MDFLINFYEAYSLHSGINEITFMFLSLKEGIIYLECRERIGSLALHKICTEKKSCEMERINKGVLGGIHN